MSQPVKELRRRKDIRLVLLSAAAVVLVLICIQTAVYRCKETVYDQSSLDFPVLFDIGATICVNKQGYYFVLVGNANEGIEKHGPIRGRRVVLARETLISYQRPSCEYSLPLSNVMDIVLGFVEYSNTGIYVLHIRWFTALLLSGLLAALAVQKFVVILRSEPEPFACLKCGYDCRLSQVRCPECGTELKEQANASDQ
jgi:hypothetical protein